MTNICILRTSVFVCVYAYVSTTYHFNHVPFDTSENVNGAMKYIWTEQYKA